MAKKRFIKSSSGYILGKRHQVTSAGTIYERDWVTIGGTDKFVPGQTPVYNSTNFKITVNNTAGARRKTKHGTWRKNASSGETWTWTDVSAATMNSVEGKEVPLTDNYTSLSDFAYFGSCLELVEASVSDIINKFPGEIYVGEDGQWLNVNGRVTRVDGYAAENPFGVDARTKSVVRNASDNVTRYLSVSYDRYVLIFDNDEENQYPVEGVTITNPSNPCVTDGTVTAVAEISGGGRKITLTTYACGGEEYMTSDTPNVRLRPCEEEIEDFFSGLDSFERALLDRQTSYTAVFETPRQTDSGVTFSKQSYQWPLAEGGYNLDVESGRYAIYLSRLQDAATYADETVSDNLYRSMTHEAIKNMDWSFRREEDEELAEEYARGGGKIANLIRLFGRQFDDLKRAIDGIGSLNRVMYNEKNAIPSYFLTDSIENQGLPTGDVLFDEWFSTDASVGIKTEVLFPGETDGYVAEEVENHFMRRLRANLRRVLSEKGTKRGIEALMGLFGIPRDWYSFKEYVYFADNFIPYNDCGDDASCVESDSPNAWVIEQLNKFNTLNSTDEYGDVGTYQGLPVGVLNRSGDSGDTLLYPAFDKSADYNGSPYFQSKGGWGKSGNTYMESMGYLLVVDTTDDLTALPSTALQNGDVYYVNGSWCYYVLKNKEYSSNVDVTGYAEGWRRVNAVDYKADLALVPASVLETASTTTFYCREDGKFYRLAALADHCDLENGWTEDASATVDEDLERVIYLNSIVDLNEGNNPHVGYGDYDGGQNFLDYYRRLFKGCSENEGFSSSLSATSLSGANIDAQGFTLSRFEDNKKCWYFASDEEGYSLPRTQGFNYGWDSGSTPEALFEFMDEVPSGTILPSYPTEGVAIGYLFHVVNDDEDAYYRMVSLCHTGSQATDYYWTEVPRPPKPYSSDWTFWKTGTALNGATDIPGGGNFYPELAVNVKTFVMRIEEENIPSNYLPEFRRYFSEILLPYVKEMVPSTAIVEFGSSLSVSSETIVLMESRPTASFLVSSSEPWEMGSASGLYTFTPSSGNAGGSEVTVSYTGFGKETVSFTNGSETVALTVMSIDITTSMEERTLTFESGNTTGAEVIVNALGGDADYVVADAPEWCSLDRNGSVLTITPTPNTTQNDRTGTVVLRHVNSSDCSTSFDVRQTFSAYAVSIEPDSAVFPVTGGTARFTIGLTGGTITNDFTIVSAPSWCVAAKVSTGVTQGQAFLDVTAQATTSLTGRTGEIVVAHAESQVTTAAAVVSQASEEVSLSVEPTTLDFPQSGGTMSLNVTATGGSGGYRIVTTTGSWFTTRAGSAGVLSVTASANAQTSQRTGEIMIAHADDSSKYVTVTLTQSEGYSITLTPENASLPQSGGETARFTVEMAGNTSSAFTINTNADWLTAGQVTAETLEDGRTVYHFTLTAPANGDTTRHTYVSVTHPDSSSVTDSALVEQAATYGLDTSPMSISADTSGGTFPVSVVATGGDLPGFAIESGYPDWLTPLKSSGTLMNLRVSRNTGAAERKGSVTVYHTSNTSERDTVQVTQSGESYAISVDPELVETDFAAYTLSGVAFTISGGYSGMFRQVENTSGGWAALQPDSDTTGTLYLSQNTGTTRECQLTFAHYDDSATTCTMRVTQTGISIQADPVEVIFDCVGEVDETTPFAPDGTRTRETASAALSVTSATSTSKKKKKSSKRLKKA